MRLLLWTTTVLLPMLPSWGFNVATLSRRQLLEAALLPSFVPEVKPSSPTLTTYDDALFEVTYPSDFFAIRRTIGGDVVRRGNVIFTAGRLSAAEVVTIEYFPVADLIAQADATSFFPDGKLGKWTDLGTPQALGEYLCERRDNEAVIAARGQKPQARASAVLDGTLRVTDDTLEADVVTDIASQTMRVGEAGTEAPSMSLKRHQRTKYLLLPGGTKVMACWASSLDDLWDSGEGKVLTNVVASLKPKL